MQDDFERRMQPNASVPRGIPAVRWLLKRLESYYSMQEWASREDASSVYSLVGPVEMSPEQHPPVDVQLLRAFKKHVVRPYRLLFNALNALLAEFTATLVQGKTTTATVSNLVLGSFCLRDWTARLGLDAGAFRLLSRRMDARIQGQNAELVGLLETLRRIVLDMRGALDVFREAAWQGGPGCDARQRELLSDTVMCERGALTYRQVCLAVDATVRMCAREVEEVKALVVRDLVDACQRCRGDGGNGGNGSNASDSELMEEAYWELRVTAWVTDLYLERDEVERYMAMMAADAGLPYFTSGK
jgi:hypothetical protein